MVQEYERAVIFRMGRILDEGAKGPGNCDISSRTHSALILDFTFGMISRCIVKLFALSCHRTQLLLPEH